MFLALSWRGFSTRLTLPYQVTKTIGVLHYQLRISQSKVCALISSNKNNYGSWLLSKRFFKLGHRLPYQVAKIIIVLGTQLKRFQFKALAPIQTRRKKKLLLAYNWRSSNLKLMLSYQTIKNYYYSWLFVQEILI